VKSVGLDLSTSAGIALVTGELIAKLEEYFLIEVSESDVEVDPDLVPEYTYVSRAKKVAESIKPFLISKNPDIIVIEQTNLGKNRNDQKLLEFIHYAVLEMIRDIGMYKNVHYVDSSRWRSDIGVKLSKEDRLHNKSVKSKKGPLVEGYRGKITFKHLAVRHVNKAFNLNLILKDNDIADAICLASWGIKKQISSDSNKSQFDFENDFMVSIDE
jgi:Holliday junction resolvasome RuvABC endonuclease subunit